MLYTVKEISKLADVTIKALHHYHKIGLLVPHEISEAGYRLYGQKELERLQEILFYRELDFSLKDISEALSGGSDREKVLSRQRRLLDARLKRLERLLKTLDDSLTFTKRGLIMEKEKMFEGFGQEEWRDALSEQNEYLKDKYGYDLIEGSSIQVEILNEQAQESIQFLNSLSQALKDGVSYKDGEIKLLLSNHMEFLNKYGHNLNPQSLLDQARFLVSDDFHRNMLESNQLGLSYYYLASVEAFSKE